MVLEFMGESGCGKTTLAKELAAELESRKIKYTLKEKLGIKSFRVFFSVKYLRVFLSVLSFHLSLDKTPKIRSVIYYLVRVLNLYYISHSSLVLCDQGLFQLFTPCCQYTPPKDRRYANVVKSILSLTEVCVVRCRISEDAHAQRLNSRQQQLGVTRRIESLSDSERQMVFLRNEHEFERIVKHIPSHCLLEIDMEEPNENNINKIISFSPVARQL